MENLFKKIDKKINDIIWSFWSTGIIFLMLAVLLAFYDFMVRLTLSLIAFLIAFSFLYAGYRIMAIKKEIKDHFKF